VSPDFGGNLNASFAMAQRSSQELMDGIAMVEGPRTVSAIDPHGWAPQDSTINARRASAVGNRQDILRSF
jgi:hypothetical protein